MNHAVGFADPVLIVQINRRVAMRDRELQHLPEPYPRNFIVTGIIDPVRQDQHTVLIAGKTKLQIRQRIADRIDAV